MKLNLRCLVSLLCLCTVVTIKSSISAVYNLRIAETSKRQQGSEAHFDYPTLATLTLFNQFREKRNNTLELIAGAMGSVVYARPTYYLRADAAGARVARDSGTTYFARSQPDDVLLSGGYTQHLNKRMNLTYSAFLGIPTHQNTSLEDIQFGYGQVGFGGQVDGAFIFARNGNHSIRAAFRLIHFFARQSPMPDVIGCVNFNVGNLSDVLFSFHSNWNRNRFELGYDLSSIFGTTIRPYNTNIVQKTTYVRDSFYASYKRTFMLASIPSSVAVALSYGFEQQHKLTGNKQLLNTWISWAINF